MHYEKVGDEGPICVEEELPFELPEGWCWSRLGCIGHWQSGATPKRSNPAYFKAGGVNWLLTGDLNDGFVYRPSGRITQLAVEETSVKLNPAGSVLLAMYGATIGKTGILGVESTTNQACCACLPLCTIPPMFVQSFLKVNKPVFLKQGIGGAQPNISKEIIVNTLIPLPPLAEQQRIVEALGHYLALVDDIEHNQTELDELLTKTRSKVLDLAIRGKLVAQDPTDEPASVLLERIHQEKLQMVADGKLKKKDVAGDSIIYRGEDNSYYEKIGSDAPIEIDETLHIIPLGWIWTRLQSVVSSLQSGCDLKPQQYNDEGSGIPYMTGASNIVDGELIFNRWTNEPKTIAHKGDLLVSCKGTVGLTALVRFSDVHIARQFMALQTNTFSTSECREYLRIIIDTQSNRLVAGSTGLIPGIDRKTILTQTIPLPPINEQVRIADYIKTSAALLQEIKKG